MKKMKLLFIATLLFSGCLNAATITWDPVNAYPWGGDIFSMDIVGTDFVSNVDGGGVNFAFDASVLNVLSVTIDESVWNFGATGIDTGDIDNVAGTVSGIVVNTMLLDLTGDFTVATIQFQTMGAFGSTTDLALTEYALNPWASGGLPINPSYVNGIVTVVPVPAAVWLFGSGLLGLLGFARRKV